MNRLIMYFWFFIVVTCAVVSCSPGGVSLQNPVPEIGAQREIDISDDNVAIIDTDSYMTMERYGDTQKIYDVKDQNAVIVICIDSESTDFDMSIEINIFAENVSDESIGKWVNNQHSDGIYPDAPQPIGAYRLPEQSYEVTSYNLVDHTVEKFGDEYDNFAVKIYVDNVSEEGVYDLKSFTTEATVHVQTKAIRSDLP